MPRAPSHESLAFEWVKDANTFARAIRQVYPSQHEPIVIRCHTAQLVGASGLDDFLAMEAHNDNLLLRPIA